jgi:hypothetical protein
MPHASSTHHMPLVYRVTYMHTYMPHSAIAMPSYIHAYTHTCVSCVPSASTRHSVALAWRKRRWRCESASSPSMCSRRALWLRSRHMSEGMPCSLTCARSQPLRARRERAERAERERGERERGGPPNSSQSLDAKRDVRSVKRDLLYIKRELPRVSTTIPEREKGDVGKRRLI